MSIYWTYCSSDPCFLGLSDISGVTPMPCTSPIDIKLNLTLIVPLLGQYPVYYHTYDITYRQCLIVQVPVLGFDKAACLFHNCVYDGHIANEICKHMEIHDICYCCLFYWFMLEAMVNISDFGVPSSPYALAFMMHPFEMDILLLNVWTTFLDTNCCINVIAIIQLFFNVTWKCVFEII